MTTHSFKLTFPLRDTLRALAASGDAPVDRVALREASRVPDETLRCHLRRLAREGLVVARQETEAEAVARAGHPIHYRSVYVLTQEGRDLTASLDAVDWRE